MNARVFFPAKRAAAMFAGAVALLLVLTALSGPAWAVFGGGPDAGGHPNVGTLICYYPQFGVIAPFGWRYWSTSASFSPRAMGLGT